MAWFRSFLQKCSIRHPEQQRLDRRIGPAGGARVARRHLGRQHAAKAGPQWHQVVGRELVAVTLRQVFEAGEFEQVKQLVHDALPRYDDRGGLLYNLACAEARLGEHDAALEHIRQSVAAESRYLEYAQTDDDLASIRGDERFPR